MAQLENEQYRVIDLWQCPYCHKTYLEKRIGLLINPKTGVHNLSTWHPNYIFCNSGCGRYFDTKNNDITSKIETHKI